MPIRLVPPRKGKTPFWYVRGTYLRVYVDQSTGTSERKLARQILEKTKRDIERGAVGEPKGRTFVSAAIAYMEAGGEGTYLGRILAHFGEDRLLNSVDQQAIDEAAVALYPKATAATRNRQVYTPIQAVLKHAGVNLALRRPKGALGQQRTDWLWPEQAFRLFKEADRIDAEFGLFLRFLTYTGLRLSEALNLRWSDVRLDEGFAYIAETKTGTPRPVYLPPPLVLALQGRRANRTRVFRFTKSGRLYALLKAAGSAAGTAIGFHGLRHTFATWMRRYAGLDVRGLVATGAWKDSQAAERYAHAVPTEEAKKAALLPVEKAWTAKAGRRRKALSA